jgi:hypothetical protein
MTFFIFGGKNMLEQKLAIVKKNLEERLSQGEMIRKEYFSMAGKLMMEQGLIPEGTDYSFMGDSEANDLVMRVGIGMEKKIGATRLTGVAENYVANPDTAMSESAAKDVSDYSDIVERTRAYMHEAIGKKEVSKSDYLAIAKEFIKEKTDLTARVGEIGCNFHAIDISFHIIGDFNVIPDKKPDTYNAKGIESALDKL